MCMVAHVCLDRSGCLVVGNQIRGEGMRGTYQVFACQPAWSTYRFWRSLMVHLVFLAIASSPQLD